MTRQTFAKIKFGDGLSVIDEGEHVIRVNAGATIDDGSITEDKLADQAVTSAKIADGTIATADLADDSITAAKIAASAVGASELAATAVTAGSYGDATHVGQFTVDADGRLTAAANVAIVSGGGGGGASPTDTAGWMPLTTVVGGTPDLVWDASDNLIPTFTSF